MSAVLGPSQLPLLSSAPVYLEVEHVTTYRYARTVEFSAHRVMFQPRAAHDLRVLSTGLDVLPFSRKRWIHDVFSNSVAIVEPLVASSELRITARFTIVHYEVQTLELPIAPEAEYYPFAYSAEEWIDLANFLRPQYPEDMTMVRDWVGRFLPNRGSVLTRELLTRITESIRNDFYYVPRDAMGTQRPTQTLALRSGTCRDFALLMIEAARGLGIAARFVSGYLYDRTLDNPTRAITRPGSPRAEQRDGDMRGSGATHAWLHVFLPGAGWVPYDPTNTLYGGPDLIRVAYTRTPEQAVPVSGTWYGAANDYLGLDVQVNVRRVNPLPEDSLSIADGEP